MNEWQILIAAGAAIALHGILANRLSKLAQPLRLEVVEDVDALLQDEGVSQGAKEELRALEASLFSWRAAWFLAIAIPVAVGRAALKRQSSPSNRFGDCAAASQRRVFATHRKALVAISSNSPIAAFLVAVELLLFLVLWVPIGRVVREALGMSGRKISQINKDDNSSNWKAA